MGKYNQNYTPMHNNKEQWLTSRQFIQKVAVSMAIIWDCCYLFCHEQQAYLTSYAYDKDSGCFSFDFSYDPADAFAFLQEAAQRFCVATSAFDITFSAVPVKECVSVDYDGSLN